MAVTYATATKTARMQATADHFVSGTLEIGTAGMSTVLATYTLAATQTGVATDTWTLQFASGSVAAAAAGTAVAAVIKTSGAAANITGLTVGTAATDIILDNNVIASGQTVTLTTATIQHAA